MPIVESVLIVGGGIAGLTAAAALCQAGIRTEMLEPSAPGAAANHGILQPNNALRALQQVGLAQSCLSVGVALRGWQMGDANGNVLLEAPYAGTAAPEYPPLNGIRLAALQQVLRGAAIARGARVRQGQSPVRIRETADRVDVEFSTGELCGYDLLVAADGLQSRVRSLLFGSDPQHLPAFTGEMVWRCNFAAARESHWATLSYGRNSSVRLVPISGTATSLLLTAPAPSAVVPPRDRLHVALRGHLQEYGGLIATLARDLNPGSEIECRPVESLLVPAPWHRGRTLLIGDAAHAATPHLGQGGALAIEDAVLLAQLLQKPRSVADALAEFMTRRFERCRLVIENSRQLGEWERLEWRGQLNADADPAGLMAATWHALLQPI